MAHRLAHVGDHALKRRRRDSWPFTVVDLDETHTLQVLHRLADRRAPHGVALHQLALGRERIAGPQVLGLDDRQQPVLDKFRQLWPRQRVQLCRERALRLLSTVQRDNLRHRSPGNFRDPSIPVSPAPAKRATRGAHPIEACQSRNWYTMYTRALKARRGARVSMGGAR